MDSESDAISVLALDRDDLQASVYDLLHSPLGSDVALTLKGDCARQFLDILQNIIDKSNDRKLLFLCRKASRKLSEKSGQLPNSLFVDNIQRDGSNAVSGGGCADIWKGKHYDQVVALKVLRVFTTSTIHHKLQRVILPSLKFT